MTEIRDLACRLSDAEATRLGSDDDRVRVTPTTIVRAADPVTASTLALRIRFTIRQNRAGAA